MFPYLGRFFSISFYFSNIKNYQKGQIILTPKNNLIDNNMDGIINIRQLEKKISEFKNADYNIPYRIFYEKEKNPWFTIEGVYMKKNPNEKKSDKKKLYSYNPENYFSNQEVFYSTNKFDVKIMIKPGKLIFLMYVVNHILNDSEEDKKEKDKKDKSKIYLETKKNNNYDDFSDSSFSEDEKNIQNDKKNNYQNDKKSSNSSISYES